MSKLLRVHGDSDHISAEVVHDGKYLIAIASMARGQEVSLALCLSLLVTEGILDIDKLRAALVLAEPVAREEAAKRADQEREKTVADGRPR